MMLNKLSRSIGSNILGNKKDLSSLKALVILSKRNFSIDEIGKRYENPYDYKNKQYGILGQIFDSTLKKLGENSLIITVEGNFGSGKTEFAHKLANQIDFVNARQPDLDTHFFQLPNGENLKEIVNGYVGDSKLYCIDSLEDWHREPTFKKSITIQHQLYNIKWMQTRTALLHLFSTGQGVVIERSVFSDSVIGQALHEQNLLSDEAYRFYLRDLVANTITELWRPHVVIYLDKSPEECLQTIKQNGKAFEKDSKVYTLNLLKNVEKNYKKNFLPNIRNEVHVLTYNSKDLNVERVIEDLERLDFEDQTKFNDWRIRKETTINSYRKELANYSNCVSVLSAPKTFMNVPEYLWYGEELVKLNDLLTKDPRLMEHQNNSFMGAPSKNISKRDWL